MPDSPPHPPHSAEYFGETRDHWWNADFVALMARRWDLGAVSSALDVGAGLGHWGRLLLPHLRPDARLAGIDREPAWVAGARARAAAAGLGSRAEYLLAAAERLPFPDAAFDLVTCQTVLMHVPDVESVLREMLRVLRPGGLLAVAEPTNLPSALVLGSTRAADEPAIVLAEAELQFVCERGKEALGEGNDSIGTRLPALFAALGLRDLAVFQCDKVALLVPPYASREQQATAAELAGWADREFWIWSREDTRRYFAAGGGTAARFAELWPVVTASLRRVAAALRARTERSASTGLFFLISGRRP